jgi:hypothetical protein
MKDGAEYIYTLIIGLIIFGVAKFLLSLWVSQSMK